MRHEPILFLAAIVIAGSITNSARAAALEPATLAHVQTATFEVVAAKPSDDGLSYEKPLPMDMLPFQERNDKYYSIGTAFAIGKNRYLTAAHVLILPMGGAWGTPELRDGAGHVYAIDKVGKFSLEKDFVEFSVNNGPDVAPLDVDATPAVNSEVFAVGNALGTGVVVRDGLYTSSTPEEMNDRWKWLRFSAAASPGNSGGPLVDKDGKVIGIVLRKSPNENLNYALPIVEATKAPTDVAEIDTRGQYRLSIFDATQTTDFKAEFKLPLPITDFSKTLLSKTEAHADAQLKALLDHETANLFPRGNGSHRVLQGHPMMEEFPAILVRADDGNWHASGKSQSRTQLSNNGFVDVGRVGQFVLAFMHRPDDISARKLHSDSVLFSDLLLKANPVKRTFGSEQIRVTTLGKPIDDVVVMDQWHRPWQLRRWAIPYANSFLLTLSLPVPDGYITVATFAPGFAIHEHEIELRAIADFMLVSYHGTLSEWKDFLRSEAKLPAAFGDINVAFDDGKQFRYESKRVSFTVSNDVQAVTASSVLVLGMSVMENDGGKFAWDVAEVQLHRAAHEPDRIVVLRHVEPSTDMGDGAMHEWQKIVQRKHPWDGDPRIENDETRVTGVVGPLAETTPHVLYSVFFGLPGSKDFAMVKAKLQELIDVIKVTDR